MAERIDEKRSWSNARAGGALVALLLAVYLPGLAGLPIVDRDEARFTQASRQMLESLALPAPEQDRRPLTIEEGRLVGGLHAGGLTVPMLGERARINKPPLVYWLQSASAWVFTAGQPQLDAPWMYRLPSVLGAIVACLATWRIGVGFGSGRAGWFAALALGVCPIMAWEAHQARSDQVLMACTSAAMLALSRVWLSHEGGAKACSRWAWMFWIATALGVLAKGPITPMIAALCIATLSLAARDVRWLARLRPMLGPCLLVLITAPWILAAASRVGFSVFLETVRAETLGRSVEPMEGHGAPPGYHLVLLPALLWPASLMMLRALRLGLPSLRRPIDPREAFLVAWIVPAWIVFELVTTKLPHYTMPIYPALALLATRLAAGDRADDARSPGPTPNALGVVLWILIGGVLCVAAPIALGVFVEQTDARWMCWGTAAASLPGLLLAARHAWAGRAANAGIAAAVVSGVMATGVIGLALPRADSLWVTRGIARAINSTQPARVGAFGYHEDSLAFLARGRLDRLGANAAESWAQSHPDGILVMPAMDTPPRTAVYLATVEGWNYSKGERVRLRVYRIANPAE
jgi:4-amino-4-deoxy-L-arabinose transferase-like glycosyltransferase